MESRRSVLKPLGAVFAVSALPTASVLAAPNASLPPAALAMQVGTPASQYACNVKVDFGAKGDGVSDDTTAINEAINYCFKTNGVPNGAANVVNNKPLYFPPGRYKLTSAITLTGIRGAILVGAGRFSTQISQATAGQPVFVTNGFEYSEIADMCLNGASGAPCFDLDWNGSGTNGVALQSNTFRNMFFQNGTHSIRIGQSNYMGSENLFLNNFYAGATVAGIETQNYNALQQSIIGGNFQNCAIGASVRKGSINVIQGVGFQGSTNCDIKQINSANDTMTIIGCRSESPNFAVFGNGPHVFMSGVSHVSSSDGTLAHTDGCPVTIERCVSINGSVHVGGSGYCTIRGSSFGKTSWLVQSLGTGSIEIEDVLYGKTFNDSGPGPAAYINKQRVTSAGTFNYALG